VEYFPGAEYRLDSYHLSKHLTEALWYDEEIFRKVATAIFQGNREETHKILEEAVRKARWNRRKKITKFIRYLEENWVGIVISPGAKRLGTIEGRKGVPP
jgi:hypothetical protein